MNDANVAALATPDSLTSSRPRSLPSSMTMVRSAGAHDWAVILAAGEGRRLRALTRLLHGGDRPKQFAAIDGERSLLQVTLERLRPRFAPERTVVVVGQDQEAIARGQLAGHGNIELVVQPANLGTGPGILLPLASILGRDPEARVAIFPSDHAVARPERLLAAVDAALERTQRFSLALVGVAPDRPETEFGWILPESLASPGSGCGLMRVRGFVEKPDRAEAERLLADGALWNTFISIGRLSRIWSLCRRWLPEWTDALESYVAALAHGEGFGGEPSFGRSALEEAYAKGRVADFSRDVLARAEHLAVIPVQDCGWNDWGSPERVLGGLGLKPERRRALMTVAALAESEGSMRLEALAGGSPRRA